METNHKREAWNKGKLVGQKPPLKPKDIWAIRIHLLNAHAVRDLAMFNWLSTASCEAAICLACASVTSHTRTRFLPVRWLFRERPNGLSSSN